MNKVRGALIGLTDRATEIVARESDKHNMSRSAWVEWVILSQQHSPAEALVFLAARRGPGRTAVVPNAELPGKGSRK